MCGSVQHCTSMSASPSSLRRDAITAVVQSDQRDSRDYMNTVGPVAEPDNAGQAMCPERVEDVEQLFWSERVRRCL